MSFDAVSSAGIQRISLINEAPNFRQVPNFQVYGVAIPTIPGMHDGEIDISACFDGDVFIVLLRCSGIQNVLQYLKCNPNSDINVVWIHLREGFLFRRFP